MSFNVIKKIENLDAIIKKYPLPANLMQIKSEKDLELKNILSGNSNKLIVIIGPCSADNEDAICEYSNKLSKINEEIKDKIFLITRVYTTKPRTLDGYKGMLHQPNPLKNESISNGLLAIRKMYIKVFEKSKIPMADEMLYPSNLPLVQDILSYIAVGARSVENQEHRLISSGLDIPVGMKNPINGNISTMINAISVAQKSNNIVYNNNEVLTSGNKYSHGILRGRTDFNSKNIPNYNYNSIVGTINLYKKTSNYNPSIIIDTNHSNSGKNFEKQIEVVENVLSSIKRNEEISKFVKGFMIESYLEDGCQNIGNSMVFGKSITDPCLGIKKTHELLLKIANSI